MPSPSLHSPINCSIPHCLSRRRERLRSIRKLLRTLNPQFDPFLELIHNSRPRPLTRPEQKNIPFLTQFGRTDFCISVSVYWLPHGNLPVQRRFFILVGTVLYSRAQFNIRGADLHLITRQVAVGDRHLDHRDPQWRTRSAIGTGKQADPRRRASRQRNNAIGEWRCATPLKLTATERTLLSSPRHPQVQRQAKVLRFRTRSRSLCKTKDGGRAARPRIPTIQEQSVDHRIERSSFRRRNDNWIALSA